MNYDPFMLVHSLHEHLFDHLLDLFGESFIATISSEQCWGCGSHPSDVNLKVEQLANILYRVFQKEWQKKTVFVGIKFHEKLIFSAFFSQQAQKLVQVDALDLSL